MRVIVYHGSYGCDTGCCGHYVEIEETGEQFGWQFSHPLLGEFWGPKADDPLEWAMEFAREAITDRFGAEHVFDLDWENSLIVDD